MERIDLLWFVFGVCLIVLEFLIPGAILSFLGLAALIVGALYRFDYISSFAVGLTWWFVLSLLLVIFLRALVLKLLPADQVYLPVDDNDDAVGQWAEVVEEIGPGRPGRIRFRDSTWEAFCESPLPVGAKVTIAERIGNGWRVGFAGKNE
ncbi:MAG: NfeD family protein [Bacteriovoracales bacterium]|nr:NfeD family protein [Bacteriovoracales bacterium]